MRAREYFGEKKKKKRIERVSYSQGKMVKFFFNREVTESRKK